MREPILTLHFSEEIYRLAYQIIDSYFSGDEEENVMVQNEEFNFNPSTTQDVPSGGFSFS